MKRLRIAADALDAVLVFVSSALLVGVTAIVFVAVVLREVAIGFSWSEEISRYAYVWLVMIGTAIGVKSGAHFRMDFLPISEGARFWVDRVLAVGVALMFLVVAISTIPLLGTYISGGQRTAVTQIPMIFPFLSVTVGAVLIAVMAAMKAIDTRSAFAPAEAEEEEVHQSWA